MVDCSPFPITLRGGGFFLILFGRYILLDILKTLYTLKVKKIMVHYTVKQVYEILEEFEAQKSKAKRKEVLLKYGDNPALKDILRGTFDDSLQFLLPEGKPPYTPNKPESVPSTLLKKHKEFGYYVKGGPGRDMPAYKRENMFIRLLESIHPEDALIVLSMVNKESPVKYLTKKLTEETFPNLIQT